METLHNGFTLTIADGAFPLSTDSMLLSDFVRIRRDSNILDLGSGCATLGLLLCAKSQQCTVTGIELDEKAHNAALDNIRRNDLNSRLHSICADLRTVNCIFGAGSFRCCVSNPPYFSGGPASHSLPIARRDDFCTTDELFQAAAWALQFGGDFYIVHKPERLGQLCGCAVKHGLEPKHLRLVRHHENGPVSLILLHCRKGGKVGMTLDEITLFDATNTPTSYYKDLYHI